MQDTQVRSLSWEDPLERGLATHSSILAWRLPWTEEPGGATVHGVTESDMTEKLALLLAHILLSTRGEGFRAAWREEQDLLVQTWGLLYDLVRRSWTFYSEKRDTIILHRRDLTCRSIPLTPVSHFIIITLYFFLFTFYILTPYTDVKPMSLEAMPMLVKIYIHMTDR